MADGGIEGERIAIIQRIVAFIGVQHKLARDDIDILLRLLGVADGTVGGFRIQLHIKQLKISDRSGLVIAVDPIGVSLIRLHHGIGLAYDGRFFFHTVDQFRVGNL